MHDGEFLDPIATLLKRWEKITTFIVIIAFSVTLEKLNRNPQACPEPPQKIPSRIIIKNYYYMASVYSRYNARPDWLSATWALFS